MNTNTGHYHVVELTPGRRVMLNMLNLAEQKHSMYGLLEVDVTVPRQLIAKYKEQTGETLSFTGFLTLCLACAVDENKEVQAYLKGRKQIIMFDDVDVGMMIEHKVGEKRALMGHVIRGANRKTYREIHDEIRSVQAAALPPNRGLPNWFRTAMLLPWPLSSFFKAFIRWIGRRDPTIITSMGGTVSITAVGMFGEGHSGWGNLSRHRGAGYCSGEHCPKASRVRRPYRTARNSTPDGDVRPRCHRRGSRCPLCAPFRGTDRERLWAGGSRYKAEMTKRFPSISFYAGSLAVICYLAFTILAYSRFPLPFSPTTNWLSDLGNPVINPRGNGFYNLGIISTALLLILFFVGLDVWKIENKKIQISMLYLAQGCGILGALSMIMSAIYPISMFETHSFWSSALYILLSTGFVFLAVGLRYHSAIPSWLLILGISTAPSVILMSIFQSVYVLEWVTLVLFLSYISLVGIETRRQFYRRGGLSHA